MPKRTPLRLSVAVCVVLLPLVPAAADEPLDTQFTSPDDGGTEVRWLTDTELADPVLREASFQEPLIRAPATEWARTATTPATAHFLSSLYDSGTLPRSSLPTARHSTVANIGTGLIMGYESVPRGATDLGSALFASPAGLGTAVQRRNPTVNEPRLRSERVGRQRGFGSYWEPARMDLDTALSKIDAQLIEDVITIKGPYAARYGPGFSFIDFELLDTPRYDDGFEVHGLTGADYRTNGQQFGGRQLVWGGSRDWGFRASYGHRIGNDYQTGDGVGIPASYNSRVVNLALGRDFAPDRHLEGNYLHVDQTGVELPGQAFDIDCLTTDAYEVRYVNDEAAWFDRVRVDAWYNRTTLAGSAQGAGKRRQFPIYDTWHFVGFTDVDALSAGYRLAGTWGDVGCEHLTVGTDLRYVEQELNEITSGGSGPDAWSDANSPIPQSYSANPGLFAEFISPVGDGGRVTAGARIDLATADVTDDPQKLASLGSESKPEKPISLADILGTDDFQQTCALYAAYLTGQYALTDHWTAELAAGYAERAPTLTEMYAAQTSMFVLQNGLNSLTGDPLLKRERLCQLDAGLRFENQTWRGGVNGFYRWAWDYITFEKMGVWPNARKVEQMHLKFVNTALATFIGAEAHAQCELTDWLTPFATLAHIQGIDETRNGDFATRPASAAEKSKRTYGVPRGVYGSNGPFAAREPLPGIVPLESRLGLRLHAPGDSSPWGLETSVRLVAAQNRVATSLLEVPSYAFAVADIRGYWRVRPNLLLAAGVENFTDTNYREHLDFHPQPGSSALAMYQPGVTFYFAAEVSY